VGEACDLIAEIEAGAGGAPRGELVAVRAHLHHLAAATGDEDAAAAACGAAAELQRVLQLAAPRAAARAA